MKKILPWFLFLNVAFCFGAGSDKDDSEITLHMDKHIDGNYYSNDHFDMDIDNKDVILTCKDNGETIVFTKEYELIINDKMINLDAHQKALVHEYHDLTMELVSEAKKVGLKGAKIGVKGAALGLTAVAGVFKLLLPGYDAEDYERDIEKKAEKIEKEAEKLEEKAKVLEIMADHHEEMHDELKQSIPALEQMEWF